MRYVKKYRVISNNGRTIGYYDHKEEAEQVALRGRSRWTQIWFEGSYCCSRQYTR